MSVHAEAFFFGAGRGARFCLLHEPKKGASRGAVLYVPPFAEEQNRARLAAARAARALSQSGYTVLQMDPYGCGDSAGDFAQASWEAWLEDLRHGVAILSRRARGPLWLWGVRAGALLCGQMLMARYVPAHTGLLLWQPVLSGAQHLKQFLRLRMARESLRDERTPAPLPIKQAATLEAGSGQTVLDMVSQEHARARLRGASHQLRTDWVQGKAVEVAGYTIAPALAFSLERAVFEVPQDYCGRVVWLDVVRSPSEPEPLPTQTMLNTLASHGQRVSRERIIEQPFWASAETEGAAALIEATRAALERIE
ncbi:MAG: hypothetical protein RIR70_1026 [Pseudomonadota bacterium]|jgi:alpha/beta superfamily hydrolase